MQITHTAHVMIGENRVEIGDLVKADGKWENQQTCPLYRVESVSQAEYHDERGWAFRVVGLSLFAPTPHTVPSSADLPSIPHPGTAASLLLVKNLTAVK